MTDPTRLQEPVDDVHTMCLDAARKVNGMFEAAKLEAASWEPAPVPAREEMWTH